MEHNQKLIEVLLNFRNDYHDDRLAIEDRRNQASIIYFMILTGLLVYLFEKSGDISEIKDLVPYFVILGVIFLMYFLNVHLEDSKHKFSYRRGNVHKAIDSLLELNITRNTCYRIDLIEQEKELLKQSEICKRWWRKFLLMISPDIYQIIYYLVPFTLVLIWILTHWP